jgi:alkaline phosphatase
MTMQHGVAPLPSCRFLKCLVCAWLLLLLATMHMSTPQASAADSEVMRTILVQAQPVAPSPTPQPSLLILPINRAKFLAGTRFDFRVEANHLPAKPTTWEVTVAGKTPEAFFGTQGQVTNTSDHSQEQTFCDVTLAEPGAYKVSVKVVAGETTLTSTAEYEVVLAKPLARQAKNVVLFIGDGMSLPFRTAARIVSRGMQEGKYRSMLEMDDMDHYAVVTTSGMESIATDSANSSSAYATGHKSVVNAMGVYPDNTPDPNDDPRVETIVELVKRTRTMAVGLVTTTEIQDATPAAMFAHTRRRSEYLAIMDQYLTPSQSADVIMGGGQPCCYRRARPVRAGRITATSSRNSKPKGIQLSPHALNCEPRALLTSS